MRKIKIKQNKGILLKRKISFAIPKIVLTKRAQPKEAFKATKIIPKRRNSVLKKK